MASQLGWKFAPILYQHPLDESWLTSPPHWLNVAASYDMRDWERMPNNSVIVPAGVEANGAEGEYLSAQQWFATRLTTPTFNSTSRQVTFDTVNGATVLKRAVVDPVVNGRLTGKVFYTVFQPFEEESGQLIPHAYVYTYMYYYPWNGCANMLVATQVDGKKQGVEFFMCGDGAHEGDLEHIKVYVCEADMLAADPSIAIRRTQYSQHGWLPDFDCTAGECTWETDEVGTRRLVALAGLFSHANWNAETPLFVYAKVQLSFLLNMDGLYIADRYKKGPVLYPDPNNTLFLPFRGEMTPQQKKGDLKWANFPGVWGATLSWTGGRTITCFYDNFTRMGPCNPRNPAYYILDVITRPKGSDPAGMNWTAETSGNTVTGPLWERVFAYSWETERAAPMYVNSRLAGSSGELMCPLEAPLRNTVSSSGGFDRISLKQYLGAVVGLVLASAVVAFAMVLPALLVRGDRAVIREVEEEEEAKQAELHGKQQDGTRTAEAGKGLNTAATPPAALLEPPGVPTMGCRGTATTIDTTTTTMTTNTAAAGNNGSSGGTSKDGSVGVPPAAAAAGDATVVTAAAVAPVGGAAAADGAAVPVSAVSVSGRSRLSLLLMSHGAILRAFQASVMQPWFLVAWIFIGVALYICGVVLGAIGVADSVAALDRVVRLSIWEVFHKAIIAVFVVFGVLHLAIVVTSIWVRPTRSQLCSCGPQATKCRLKCLNQSWAAHAVLVGLLVMEMNVSMLLFAFGLMLWVARYLVTQACVAAVKAVFKGIVFLDDVCLDLSSIGLNDHVCGTALTDLCNIWGDLNVDYLSFGSMCFIIAQAMFLVLATTNYVATRTGYAITTVMQLTQKTEAERAATSGAHAGSSKSGGGLSFLFGRSSANGVRSRSNKAGQEAAGGGGDGKAADGSKKGAGGGKADGGKGGVAMVSTKSPAGGAGPDRV